MDINFKIFSGFYHVQMDRFTPPDETFHPNDTDHEHSDEIDSFYARFDVKVQIPVIMKIDIFPKPDGTRVINCPFLETF